MARTTPKPPTRRTRNLPGSRFGQPRPRHPRAPARNRTAHRSGPPRRPLRGGLAEARPGQPAPVSGGRHIRLQGHALRDGRHGQRPRTRSATGIHPRQPQAGAWHRIRDQAAGSAWNWPSPTASTSAEAGASDFNSVYFPPPSRHRTTTAKTLLRARKCLLCLVQEQSEELAAVSRHARTRPDHPPENRPFPNRAVPVDHLPQDYRGHVPTPDQDQHSWRWLARIRHQPLDRRSGIVASERPVR